MNVFVLSTGRCGSTTFERACRHITNYSSGHETRVDRLGPDRLDYPSRHIESDNRLSWFLGRMERRYPREVFYVHLQRDPRAVARSYARRLDPGLIMSAYAHGIYLYLPEDLENQAHEVALDYVQTVTANIELFLAGKPNKMQFRLENAKQDFRKFWDRIGAEGDLEAALAEFDVAYNAESGPYPPSGG
ncbi:hypothetical protein [Thiohalomonas denitrificans]|uniref:Sulfotransferase family protein n=1 Tax=Thiohalomonas denitrificans TaxID=415747 RepID=A0A1G5QWY7_9GAMM|nr:hypothetical protein [Thiohalomonas denitrificans]SCZ65569.1 hypothetical protein SAMN03097708_02841 [Thiohalomonas denitrificans]